MVTYVPGTWFAVVGPRAAVLVPPEESARVAGLWELVQAEPALSELLDTFLRDGLGRLPSFALATWNDEGGGVVLRGPVRVEAGGDAFDGAGISTWVERRFGAGDPLTLRTADATDGPVLAMVAGVVLAGSVVVDTAARQPAREQPVREEPVREEPVDDEPAGVAGQEGLAVFDSARSALLEDPGAQAPEPTLVPRLEFSHGESVDLDRTVITGRAPEARRAQPGQQPRLVVVRSPQLEVSSTHLEVRPDGGVAVATDLNSTNGTLLTRPGTEPVPLTPGEPTVVGPGCVLDLGDGVTITVTEAAARRP